MKPVVRSLQVLLAVLVGVGTVLAVVSGVAFLRCSAVPSCELMVGPGFSETSTQWSPSTLDGVPAAEILRRAQDTVRNARWGEVEMLGNGVGGHDDFVRLRVDGKGNSELYASLKEQRVWLREVDGVVYLSGHYPASGRLEPIPEGRWVRARPGDDPRAELRRLSHGLAAYSLQEFVGNLLDDSGRPVRITGRESTVAGPQKVLIGIGEGSTVVEVAVAAEGSPGPLSIDAGPGRTLCSASWDDRPEEVRAPFLAR